MRTFNGPVSAHSTSCRPVLGLRGRGHGVARAIKRHAERVADRLEHVAMVALHRGAQNRVVPLQGHAHGLGVMLPEPGAASISVNRKVIVPWAGSFGGSLSGLRVGSLRVERMEMSKC